MDTARVGTKEWQKHEEACIKLGEGRQRAQENMINKAKKCTGTASQDEDKKTRWTS